MVPFIQLFWTLCVDGLLQSFSRCTKELEIQDWNGELEFNE